MRSRRNGFRVLVVLEAVVLTAVVIFGVIHMKRAPSHTGSNQSAETVNSNRIEKEMPADENTEANGTDMQSRGSDTQPGQYAELPSVTFSVEVNTKLASMTLEEKVAQMFLTTPEALTHNDSVEVAGDGTREAINTYPVGGLVYSSVNFQDQEQTRNLLQGVQQFSNERIGLPMFLAVEELGGPSYSPLASQNGYELCKSPSETGAGGDPTEAAKEANTIASYLAEESFNLNLAPLADLAGNIDTGYDSKCFGTDASLVSMMVAESINAYHTNGILTASGRFPGKGSGNINQKDFTEWQNNDALPYQAAVNAGTDFMILGNVTYEPLTGSADALCSLSRQTVSYLRNDLAYTGVLMTESLSDENISGQYTLEEAAVEAVKAGVNMLYCPTAFETAYQAVLDEVNNGGIPQDTVDQAAGYILAQKMEM